MKRFFPLLYATVLAASSAFGAALDIRIGQRNAQDTAWMDVIFAKQNSSLIGTTSAGRPSIITIGDGLDLTAGILTATGGGGGAPTNATFITQTPNGSLSNEQALSLLSSGILRVATTTGVITSLGDVLPVANGGTGQSSFINGQLLIGNTGTGGLTKATLTEGVSTWITNSTGSITISGALNGLTNDWNGTTGTDNQPVIQAAFTAGVKKVIIPPGRYKIASTVAVPPGCELVGYGDSATGTEIAYTGSGRGITLYAVDSAADLLKGGRIAGFKFTGTSANVALVSLSDVFRVFVEHCTFEGATTGTAIELRNQVTWTEGARLISNQIRGCLIHYFFNIDGGTDSYAETVIQHSSDVLTVVGERVLVADATANIYGSDIYLKCNVVVPPASLPTTTKSVLIDLGAGAHISESKLFLFSELQEDRIFLRHKLGAGAYISAQGYHNVAAATGMSSFVGATDPWDDVAATAALYLGPSGEYITGTIGGARLGAGQAIYAQKAFPSAVESPIAYLPHGTTRLNVRYTGSGVEQAYTLKVSTSQYADSPTSASQVLIEQNQIYAGSPVFDGTNPPYLKFSTDGNPFLYLDMANTVSDGYLTITAEIETFLNSGSSLDFGILKPLVLFPSMSGITVGAVKAAGRTPVTIGGDPTFFNGEIAIGNTTSGVADKATLTAGTGITITNAAGSITINATGSGNVTNNATLALGNITIGGGTTVIGTSNMSWNATNNTLTTPELVVTNNSTFGNITTTNLTISGAITGVMPLINGGTGFSATTAGNIIIGNNTTTYGQLGVGANGTVLTSNTAATLKVSWETPSGGAALTANYAGYGNATNILTGEAAYQYNPTSNILTVGGVSLGAGSEVSTIGPLVDAVDGTTPLNNINQVVATGTAYTMTATYGSLDFGTTDPILTIANAGTYAIYVDVQLNLVGATYATYDSATIKLRRTNNTAADLTGSTFGTFIPTISTITAIGPYLHVGPIKYQTSNTDDTITVQGILNSTPAVGSVTATAVTITAIRAY